MSRAGAEPMGLGHAPPRPHLLGIQPGLRGHQLPWLGEDGWSKRGEKCGEDGV